MKNAQSKLKYGLKKLTYTLVWKKFSNLENYFDFYLYICHQRLKIIWSKRI